MFRADFSKNCPFALVIFGCQYHGALPNPSKASLIETFDGLIKGPATHVEVMEHDDLTPIGGTSKVWMSYWKSVASYDTWWKTPEVTAFWASLPDDAGFWREKLQFPDTRVLFESNKRLSNGFSHVGSFEPLTEKTGYWGSYRDRLEEATVDDRLSSPIESILPVRNGASTIHRGRVVIEQFPNNLCFVMEGQDLSAMTPREHKYWLDNFNELTNQWLTTATMAENDDGMVSARLCYNPFSGPITSDITDSSCGEKSWPFGLGFNRRLQMLYFLDLSYMERIGRKYKSHVQLRKEFMMAYGPSGDMEGGDLLVWVDLGILKAKDMEAEYIGCYEGTGFMAYMDHPAFRKGLKTDP